MKTIVILLATFLLGFTSFSQTLEDPGTPEERAAKITQQMVSISERNRSESPKRAGVETSFERNSMEGIRTAQATTDRGATWIILLDITTNDILIIIL